ncbi:hypothetical protein [Puia dinghuensis]|uniref:Gliding motility-associated protein GldM N-terminal domain-containing protein n=1 Tax=Puia dinghuensis TaxID=1792502 RepID=A0A8J2XUK4_9BACT|nr:hypothetical protein [Puia dinghuensis]GGB11385.1 hypothetical protein GCM10011511_38730 [Puia dinghuensis]
MLNLRIFGALIAAISLLSCGQHNDPQQLLEIRKGFERSNKFVENENDMVYAAIEQKRADAVNRHLVELYSPVLKRIRAISNRMNAYVDSLKLNGEADLDQQKQRTLVDRLAAHKRDLIAAFDSTLLGNEWRFVSLDILSLYNYLPLLKGGAVSDLQSTDAAITMLLLDKLQSDIRLSEHLLIDYCNKHTTETVLDGEWFLPIVSLSSSRVRPGEPIEVFAGISMFSYRMDPKITINSVPVKLGGEPVARDTIKAKRQPGRYFIPVKIEYSKPDGTICTMEKNCYYTVVAGR